MAISKLTADFVTSTLSGALAAGAATATIGSGLDLPATNGVLHLDYDSSTAVGLDNGPETITYATYTTATGALAGLTRGAAGTTDVAHANGATVSAGISVEHLNEYDSKNGSDQTIIGKNDVRAVRFVPISPAVEILNVDPADANFADVDVTANTSANTYAVQCWGQITSDATQRNLYARKKGDATVAGSANMVVRGFASLTAGSEFIVPVDTGQIFEYAVSNAGATLVAIFIKGYWEYVD